MQLSSSKAALVLLALIVTVSGCADNSGESVSISQTEGVSVEKFDATPTDLFEGQLLTLELQLKNKGGTDAKNVVAKLYNVPFEGSRSWSIQSPSSNQQQISFDSLRAANPETDAPATSIPRTWTIKAPDLDQGVTIPYDFQTRIYYQYETSGTTDIQVMSDQRYRETGATRSKPTIDNSGGPVQLEVKTRTPIVFFSGTEGEQSSQVCVIVKNEGEGRPFLQNAYKNDKYAVTDDKLDKVKLQIESSGSRASFESTSQTVSMVSGRGIKCFTMNVDRVSSQQIQQTIPVTFTAKYGYYNDASTSVTVNGRTDGSSSSDDSSDDSSSDGSWSWTSETPDFIRNDKNPSEYCPDASQENREEYCTK